MNKLGRKYKLKKKDNLGLKFEEGQHIMSGYRD